MNQVARTRSPASQFGADPGGRRLDAGQPPDDLPSNSPINVGSAAAVLGTGPALRPTTRRSTRSRCRTGPADIGQPTSRTPSRRPRSPSTSARSATGAHIAAVGSSDSHQADQTDVTTAPIGRGATVVGATELSKAAIVDGVRDDHTYAKLYGSDGPDIRVTARSPGAGDAIFGDTMSGPSLKLEVEVLRAGAGRGAARRLRPCSCCATAAGRLGDGDRRRLHHQLR